jgi:hypothetical protein
LEIAIAWHPQHVSIALKNFVEIATNRDSSGVSVGIDCSSCAAAIACYSSHVDCHSHSLVCCCVRNWNICESTLLGCPKMDASLLLIAFVFLVGKIGNQVRLSVLVDLVYGAMWYRLLMRHAPLDARFAEELTQAVIQATGSSH